MSEEDEIIDSLLMLGIVALTVVGVIVVVSIIAISHL